MMKQLGCFCIALLFCWYGLSNAQGGRQALPKGCELIGEIIFRYSSLSADSSAMRSLDALVPKLKKSGKGKAVRIEGNFAASSRDEKVKKSLSLAKEVERYLRLKHNLELDLYLTVQDDIVAKGNRKSVRIVLYPYDFSEIKI
jgi:hypothetical protein